MLLTITNPRQIADIQSIFQDYFIDQDGDKFTFLLEGVRVTFEYKV